MPLRRAARFLLAAGAAAIFSAGLAGAPAENTAPSLQSEIGAWRDAWRQAEAYAAEQPGREVVVGRGDSMLPLYRDRTVLVLETLDMSAWRAGMTVVFIGDQGRPVAHTLVSKTKKGWIACGLANPERDRTLVRPGNYIGTVVRAFAPARDEIPARIVAVAPDGERLASAGQ